MDVGSFARTSIKWSFHCLLEKRWIEIISSFQKLTLTFTCIIVIIVGGDKHNNRKENTSSKKTGLIVGVVIAVVLVVIALIGVLLFFYARFVAMVSNAHS